MPCSVTLLEADAHCTLSFASEGGGQAGSVPITTDVSLIDGVELGQDTML